MSLAIREAVYSRWNAAGLDTSIAPLYAGDESASPEGSALPRAQYALPDDSQRARSRGSRELLQTLRFQVWATGDRTAQEYVDLIEASYVNSETAQSDPFAVAASAGTILDVRYRGQAVVQEDEAVFQGVLDLEVQWVKPISGPSA